MDATTFRPDWTSLPSDLLASIAKLLQTRTDILRFRAVCCTFRSTVPPPSKLPVPRSIMRTTDFLRGPNPRDDDLFFLIESTVYAIEPCDETSPQTWLVKVEERKPGRVQIQDPLSGFRFESLSMELPKSLNLLDYRVKEISKAYVLESAAIRKGKAKVSEMYPRKPSVYAKVIVSSFLDEIEDGFAAMTKYRTERELAVWRNLDKRWSNIYIRLKPLDYFEDMVYHNHKFYAVVSTGLTVAMDSESLIVSQVAAAVLDHLDFSLLYLVESLNDLLLIVQLEDTSNYEYEYFMKVFKLDEEKREWLPVVDGLGLEDRVFFVGEGGSYSVSAAEFSGCKGNCVYFSVDDFEDGDDYPGRHAWIFDLKDGKARKLSDSPGYSDLFWPPPTWLSQMDNKWARTHPVMVGADGHKWRRGSSRDDREKIPRLML